MNPHSAQSVCREKARESVLKTSLNPWAPREKGHFCDQHVDKNWQKCIAPRLMQSLRGGTAALPKLVICGGESLALPGG